MAMQRKIKTGDFLTAEKPENANWTDDTLRFVKEYIRNRCIPAYPDEPIYIKQMEKGIQKGILDANNDAEKMHSFCLFHVMLHTLRYTNEIVVDLSQNSLQALFWLGVAHGSDVHAITVRHAPTDQELARSDDKDIPAERHIFDVAGLWTAILRTNDTDGFYQQLTKAQVGIEQSSKLVLPESEKYRDRVMEQYYAPSPYMKGGHSGFKTLLDHLDARGADVPSTEDSKRMLKLLQEIRENERLCEIWRTLTEQNQRESDQLESYYRSCFWRRLLRQNALKLYIPEKQGKTEGDKPCRVNISWDVSATTELSHYLSKRMMIGSYRQTMLRDDSPQPYVWKQNFITIGNDTKPFPPKSAKAGDNQNTRRTLVDYARDELKSDKLRKMMEYEVPCPCAKEPNDSMIVRGFFEKENESGNCDVFAWFPTASCIRNMGNYSSKAKGGNQIYYAPVRPEKVKNCGCNGTLPENGCYQQLAQMVLWREVSDKNSKEMRFWVSLVGVSGPATLALTTLLVDPDQKEELFRRNGKACGDDKARKKPPQHLLNRLQVEIRKSFVEKYNTLLEKRMTGDTLEKVRYATNLYLSTVLYQYFFPFLTKADEKRITNGMKAFLDADNQIIDDSSVTKAVIEALEEAMHALQGVEALYTVTVEYSSFDTDSRWPKEIKPLEHKGSPVVSCLFMEATGEQIKQTNT